ncbi:MAG TPA: regulatory protein RecX [Woeseiaceae bacterium]
MIPGLDTTGEDERRTDAGAARRKAMDRLARREYGRTELVGKLIEDGFDPGTAGAVVERLTAEHLQDDARFAESLVSARIRQGKGPVRIRLELAERGIEPALVEQALADEDWLTLARRVRERRFGPELPADFPDKARQMRFLQYRGFEPDQIAAAVVANDP